MFSPDDPSDGYELIWPHELLRQELECLYRQGFENHGIVGAIDLLFDEAFVGPDPREDLALAVSRDADQWSGSSRERVLALVGDILGSLDTMRSYQRRQYYQERVGRGPRTAEVHDGDSWELLLDQWRESICRMDLDGYFDRRAGSRCPDLDPPMPEEHERLMVELIADRSGLRREWPPQRADIELELEEFFTLLEVLHDLVARPRRRDWHDFQQDYHYADFNQRAGQAVYRWKINLLLARHLSGYRIAEEGEDLGRVVTTVPDPRADLVQVAARDLPDGTANQRLVEHAIALYRDRGATTEDKRSACKALADVLENRRKMIQEYLLSKDESALFEYANKYRIRHHRADQRGEYSEEFLDWIFWNFLSAVQLTNRLLLRPRSDETAAGS